MVEKSYWMDTANAPFYPEFSGEAKCDVAVIGAGMTGMTTALLLSKAGADVVVLEASRVGSGTSGYTTAKVTTQHGLKLQTLSEKKGEAYARANEAGLERVAALINEYGIDCDFTRAPSAVYTRDEDGMAILEKELREYARLGILGSITDKTGLPFDVKGALVLEEQAQFHPLKYLYALADIFVRSGGRVYEHSAAEGFDRNDACIITTKNGRLISRSVVFATNYPLIEFPGMFFLKLHQERTCLICTDAGGINVAGMYINIHEPINSVRMHYCAEGNKLLLGGFGYRTGEENDKKNSYAGLEDLLHADFKNAGQEPTHKWSAQDCFTLDGMPYIGAVFNKSPNVYVATGYEKWGMTNSAAAAMMLTDDIAGTSYIERRIREQFDPIRFTPGASAKNFFAHTGTVVKAFTTDNLLLPSGSYEDVENGEAAVMRVNGKAQCIYRDDEGQIHAFSAHCTHLKCTLEYNEAEKSFDCPCHGSRFSVLGEVLDGPAKLPLEPVEADE